MDDEESKLLPSSDGTRSFLYVWRRDYCPQIPARYVLAFMSFLGFCNVYALRVNLSVAIVEMDSDTVTVQHGAKVADLGRVCGCGGGVLLAITPVLLFHSLSPQVFHWSTTEQGRGGPVIITFVPKLSLDWC